MIATLEGHRDGVKRVAFSPDGGRLLTQGPDELLLWDLATKKSVKVVPRPPFLPARFSHDGKLIFMEHLGDNAEIFDVATGATRRVKSDPQVSGCFNSDGASQVRFRPDGASMHRPTKPFDTDSADKGHPLDVPAPMKVMGDFEGFSPFTLKGDLLAVKGKDRNVQLWQVATGKRIGTLPKSQGSWYTFSPDGKLLAAECGEYVQRIASPSGVKDEAIKVFDTATGRERATLELHPDDPPIRYVVFSPDSRLIASASNYTVKVWTAATGKLLAVMDKPKLAMHPQVVFRKGGRQLAGLTGGAVHVWNTGTGKLVHAIPQATGVPDFSPDGQSLAVGQERGPVRLYRLP